jgi:uncharacterized protein (TIGR00369 family)
MANPWEEQVHGELFPTVLRGLSGIEQLRLFLSGHVGRPPIGELTGMHLTEVGVGTATFAMPITGWLQAPQGRVTGGAVAVLADGPLGCAVHTALPPAIGYTTTELSINMVRPVPAEGQLIARGRLVHASPQLGLSEVFVTDHAGRLIAHGTSRCAVFPPDPSIGAPPPIGPAPDRAETTWTPPYERPVIGTVLNEEIWQRRSGLEVMHQIISGQLPLPPSFHLFGHRPTSASEGNCQFTMPAHPWLASPTGFVEGGVTAFLADSALGGAVQTTVPAGTAIAPTDLRVQFLRPIPTDGSTLTAHATVVHRGRGFAAARAEVTNDAGKLVALAGASALIQPGRPANLREA